MVDAAAAVALADGWTNVPAMRTSGASSGQLGDANFPGIFLPDRDGNTVAEVQFKLSLDSYVSFIEFVEIEIEFRHDYFRDLQIELESPSGEVSVLSVPALALGQEHFNDSHRFGSAKHLGESAEGTWILKVGDYQTGDAGRLMSWSLKVYGHGYAPGRLSITSARSGAGSAAMAWDAPADIGGSAITSYDLRYRKLQDPDWTEVTNVGTLDDRTYTLTGLDGTVDGVNVGYVIQIRAVNDAGGGRWSATSLVQPWRVAPDAPQSVRTAARNQALAVSWQEHWYIGAGPIEAYHIRHIEQGATDKADDKWTTLDSIWQTGGGEHRYVITGLENGTAYEVQVRAENYREPSKWSSVARGTPANINGPAEFPTNESGRRSSPENTPAGVDIGDPVSARDDEGDTRTYSLTSGAANFDIVSTTGQLQTKAALDRERTSSYSVTVAVHDGKASDGTASTATDDTIRVTINIEDVDEPPLVIGSATRTVRENTTAVATYSASDPERATTTFTWSLAGDDAGEFAISDRGVLTFYPAPNYEAPTDTGGDNTYEVTVRATDASATDPGAITGEFEVAVTVADVDEPPVINGTTRYTIAENSARGVGSYTATDPERASTTWLSLTGADARHFMLDEFGALSFVETPDYDRATNGNHAPEYRVTIRASDEGNRTGSYPVTITLTPVAEGPLIEGDAVIDVNEGHTGTLETYTKRDPEDSATNWGAVGSPTALSGADADAFDFDQSTGRLTFKSAPDYEDGGGSYQVTINANDGVLDGSLDVTVNVANLDERADQPVQLGAQRGVINVALTATLTDPDNVVSATWQWQRSTSRTGGWADIANTDASSYTPTAADRNHYLRATVSYEDGHGPGKSADAVTERTTVNERATNTAPVLPDSLENIAIPEDTPEHRNVGSPILATDEEGDEPVYRLSGSSDFVIGRTTGQIRVPAGADFDYDQGQRSYTLTVTADDGFGGTDTVAVTVDIEDVNEAPVAANDAPSVAEDGTIEIDVLANDSDPENDTLSLVSPLPRSPRWGTATVDTSTNRISYTPRANYHGPDSFSYRVQDDGSPSLSSTAIVSITVDPVNDAPTFPAATAERSVSESAEEDDNVGAPVTATDIDGDDLTYSLSGTDAFAFDIDRDSGQIAVAAGVTFDIATQDTYEVTVTASDSGSPPLSASVDVTITITTGPVASVIFTGGGGGGGGGASGPTPSTVDFEWTVKRDIEALDARNDTPTGMWSDGATLWLVDNPDGAGDAVYAYHARIGERLAEREFALDEQNRAPRGIWSNREGVAWVSDSGRDRLFAYSLAAGGRLEDRDIDLAESNSDPRGIWSDGATMWVLNRNPSLFAYDLASGDLLGEYALDSRNGDPYGIWSDGVTVWISDHGEKDLLAYRLPTRREPEAGEEAPPLERLRDEDFTQLSTASNNSPRGIWSDGDVMYVADESDDRVYSYNMPDAIDARLASLTLSGVDIGEFDPGQTEYEGVIAEGLTETMVAAEAMQRRTDVVIDPPDAEEAIPGHQVSLQGVDTIAVTVTSADGSRTRVYRVTFELPVEVIELESGFKAIEWTGPDGAPLSDALGDIRDHVTVVYAWDEAASTWLAFFPALAGVPGTNTLTAFEHGRTYWIAVTQPATWTVELEAPRNVQSPPGS